MDRPEVRVPVAGYILARDGRLCVITIGIDPDKSSLTAVVVEVTGKSVATMRIAITVTTVRQLQEWAACWPQRRWAVEGAEGLGRGVAAGLASAGEQVVVDVPAQLAARARLLNWRSCSQDRRAGRGLGGRSRGAPPAASPGPRRGS